MCLIGLHFVQRARVALAFDGRDRWVIYAYADRLGFGHAP